MIEDNQDSHLPNCATTLLLAASLIALAFSGPARSGSLEVVPIAQVGAEYESNPRLDKNDEDDAAGLILDGSLNTRWASERTSLEVTPRARFSFYADGDDKDLEDENLYLDSKLKHITALSEYGLDAGYSTVGVRQSEVESAGDGSGSGSGNVRRADDSRQTFRISPSWSRMFGTRNRVSANAGYTDVDFDKETLDTGRLPYEYWNGSLSFERTVTEKTGVGILFDASKYESDSSSGGTSNETDTRGASLFLNHTFTETLSGSAYGGWRTSNIDLQRQPVGVLPGGAPLCLSVGVFVVPCTEKFGDDNFTGQVSLTKQQEITSYTLKASRSINPNSNGTETLRDTIDVLASRKLTPRLNGDVGILYYTQEDIGDFTNRQVTYISARFALRWKFTEFWSLVTSYRYVNDQDEGLGGFKDDASNHYVYLGARYQGRGWRR